MKKYYEISNEELQKGIELKVAKMNRGQLELNYIKTKIALENSIPKEVIEDKIKEIKQNGYWYFLEKRDNEKIVAILQELLEEK